MTRRGLMLPVMAGLAVSACAPLSSDSNLGPEGWLTAHAPYGPDLDQRVQIFRPEGAFNLPLVLLLTQPRPDQTDQQIARVLADMGLVMVLVQRRSTAVGAFPAYMSDAARAMAWSVQRAGELGASGQTVGLVGLGEGGLAGLMLAHDPRYLQTVGLQGRLRAVVAVDAPLTADPTYTHPSAYDRRLSDVTLWSTGPQDLVSRVQDLKQKLITVR